MVGPRTMQSSNPMRLSTQFEPWLPIDEITLRYVCPIRNNPSRYPKCNESIQKLIDTAVWLNRPIVYSLIPSRSLIALTFDNGESILWQEKASGNDFLLI